MWAKTADRAEGFSLVEVLVALAVVAILAGLIFGLAGGIGQRSAAARAEGELAALSQALERFRSLYGDYPWVTGDEGFLDLYAALTGTADVRGRPFPALDGARKRQHFVDLSRFTVGRLDSTEPVTPVPIFAGDEVALLDSDYARHFFMDPWGSPYIYLYRTGPDDAWERGGYVLLSLGPSGGEERLRDRVQDHGVPPSGILPPDYTERETAHDNILAP
ncbi:MAG: prepilin-type N-terminal cleavage/methylation domain-containing protein [Opitutales bacterium]|nr:prepilin-type N-terminal cleavage/methylation domain-containing protein [Opitutales bacterium]